MYGSLQKLPSFCWLNSQDKQRKVSPLFGVHVYVSFVSAITRFLDGHFVCVSVKKPGHFDLSTFWSTLATWILEVEAAKKHAPGFRKGR